MATRLDQIPLGKADEENHDEKLASEWEPILAILASIIAEHHLQEMTGAAGAVPGTTNDTGGDGAQ